MTEVKLTPRCSGLCWHCTEEGRDRLAAPAAEPVPLTLDAQPEPVVSEASTLRDRIMLPTRLLRCEWPPNSGVQPGDAQFDALFPNIREHGIREPLTINLDWKVIDGAHRLNAARLLGIEWVPVRIWTGVEWLPDAPSALASPDKGKPRPARDPESPAPDRGVANQKLQLR